jgi:N,N'-diacetylchitobiose phosphorylase
LQDIATGPRHQQSNFTVGPDHPNFGMQLFSNFTGSVPWYRRVIERMLGVYAGYDELIIDPCPPSAWDAYELRRNWRGRTLHVSLTQANTPGVLICLNGQTFERTIPLRALSETELNRIDVRYV